MFRKGMQRILSGIRCEIRWIFRRFIAGTRECEDSHILAYYLLGEGYTDVRVFIDGYPGWEAENLPVER